MRNQLSKFQMIEAIAARRPHWTRETLIALEYTVIAALFAKLTH